MKVEARGTAKKKRDGRLQPRLATKKSLAPPFNHLSEFRRQFRLNESRYCWPVSEIETAENCDSVPFVIRNKFNYDIIILNNGYL